MSVIPAFHCRLYRLWSVSPTLQSLRQTTFCCICRRVNLSIEGRSVGLMKPAQSCLYLAEKSTSRRMVDIRVPHVLVMRTCRSLSLRTASPHRVRIPPRLTALPFPELIVFPPRRVRALSRLMAPPFHRFVSSRSNPLAIRHVFPHR